MMQRFLTFCCAPIKFVRRYFQHAKSYSNVRFVLEMTLLGFFVRFIWIIPFLGLLREQDFYTASTKDLASSETRSLSFLFDATVFVPLVETLCGQWLPIAIASIFTKARLDLIIIAGTFFAALHLHAGFVAFIVILSSGFLYAWSFLVKREQSLWLAIIITSLIHGLMNLILFCLQFLPGRTP